jgi:hypothetical protein
MDSDTRQNWQRIKDALEAAGKTDNHYYRRAVAVLKTGEDPFDKLQALGFDR